MSILIKGVEMPPNCFGCPLSVLNGERLFCEVTKDEVVRAKRASGCPLVPVPPHGRLIDADALREQMAERHHYFGRLSDPLCLIEDAPTIIESEEEE